MPDRKEKRPVYQLGDLILDTRQETVLRGRETLDLPLLSYRVLLALTEAAPSWVSTDDLLELVWADTVVNEETVKQRISLLRKSLGDRGAEPRYIRSSRGRGYRLVPDAVRLTSSPRRHGWRRVTWVAGVALGVLLGGLLLVRPTPPDSTEASWPDFLDAGESLPDAAQSAYQQAVRFVAMDEPHHLIGASQLLEQVIETAPDSAPAFATAAYALAASALDWGGPADSAARAERYARRALAIDGNQTGAHVALALSAQRGGRFDVSASHLADAHATAPQSDGIIRRQAGLALARGELSECLIQFHQLKSPANKDRVMAGMCLWEMGLKEPARALWRDLAAANPQWWLPAYYLSLDELLTGRLDSAMQRMHAMMQLYPACQACQHRAATIAFAQGQLEEAAALFGQALEASPTDNYMRIRLALLADGNRTPLLAEARRVALDALASGNGHWVHPWVLASLAVQDANWDEAAARYAQALEAGRVRHEWDLIDPMFESVRETAWFREVLTGMAQRRAEMQAKARAAGVATPLQPADT